MDTVSSMWKVGIEEGRVQCDWVDTVCSMWKVGIEEGMYNVTVLTL